MYFVKFVLTIAFCAVCARGKADPIPAIITAIRTGKEDIVRRLAKEEQRDVSPPYHGLWDYPLIEACNATNLQMIKILVENGANVNVKGSQSGCSALMLSASYHWGLGVDFLINHGALSEGVTPLMVALLKKDFNQIARLAESPGALDAKDLFNRSVFYYASPDRRCFALLLEYGAHNPYTPLSTAAILDDANRLSMELKLLSSRTNSIYPLMWALRRAIEYDSRNAARLLLSAGANTGLIPEDHLSALCVAAKYGRAEMIQILLDAGADPLTRCDILFLPSHFARIFGHTNCLALLPQVPLEFESKSVF